MADRIQEKTDEIIRLRHQLAKRNEANSFMEYRVGIKDAIMLTEKFIVVKAPSLNEAVQIVQQVLTACEMNNFWIIESMGVQ